MKRLQHTLSFIIFSVALTACSNIAEDERLIEVDSPTPVNTDTVARQQQHILLEDFTGQRCVNCPRGTEVIEQLTEQLSDSVLIAVGIHGGPLAFAGNARVMGLKTAVGDEYYDYWKLEYQPVGLVNRHGAVNYTDWTTHVAEALGQVASVNMWAKASIAADGIQISVKAEAPETAVAGRLQVWLLEDGITAMQMMPDGSTNADYVHNHVLRTPVNGTWGEEITLGEGETKTFSLTQPLDEQWNAQKLSIVAFVYNDSGVLQVVKTKVK